MQNTWAWLAALAGVLACGCAQDLPSAPQGKGELQVVARMGQQGPDRKVAAMVLKVEAADWERAVLDTQAVAPGQEEVVFELELPAGRDRLFTIEALDVEGQVLYTGAVRRDLEGEGSVEIPIEVKPALALRIVPADTTVALGAEFALQVEVRHAIELFGASFELVYGAPVAAVEATAGPFLGADALLFSVPDDRRAEAGRLTVSIVRRGRSAGAATGSGWLGTLRFQALQVGVTEIRFDGPTVTLQDENGLGIFGLGEVDLQGARVEVRR